MNASKRIRPAERRRQALQTDWTPLGLGVEVERYRDVLRYLFDRPVPEGQQHEWYWGDDHRVFPATSLEWTKFQTAIFANAATDLSGFDNEQLGMGLNYLMDSGLSDVPFAALDPTESARDLWRLQPLRRWSHEQVKQVLT